MEEPQRAAVHLLSRCRGERNAGCKRKGVLQERGKEGNRRKGGGVGVGDGEGGRKGGRL